MTIDEAKLIAEIAKAIFFILATTIGGLWVAYSFFSLKSIEKSKNELELLKRSLHEQGELNIKLKAEAFYLEGFGDFLAVAVHMKNIGSTVEIIEWSKAEIWASKIAKGEDNEFIYSQSAYKGKRDPSLEMENTAISPGSEHTENFLISLPEKGLFNIYFRAVCSPASLSLSENERMRLGLEEAQEDAEYYWYSDMYYKV